MKPVHPTHDDAPLEYALIPVVLAMILLLVSVWLGTWDKFIAVAVKWFPLWHWGG